jgi:hypothetical protein
MMLMVLMVLMVMMMTTLTMTIMMISNSVSMILSMIAMVTMMICRECFWYRQPTHGRRSPFSLTNQYNSQLKQNNMHIQCIGKSRQPTHFHFSIFVGLIAILLFSLTNRRKDEHRQLPPHREEDTNELQPQRDGHANHQIGREGGDLAAAPVTPGHTHVSGQHT